MGKQVIAVIGGTGTQGGGVVEALLKMGRYAVRVPSHDAGERRGQGAREARCRGGQRRPPRRRQLEGAYGAFLVTNFWDPAQMQSETEIGTSAVKAARAAGVQHLVWSTLPDVEKLSGGRFKVAHFTGKARVDAAVEAARFPRHTFVRAPMYFQNFVTRMGQQPSPTGGRGWAVPMDVAARVMHAGDPTESRYRAVAAAFAAGNELPNGSYLDVCGGVYSSIGCLNSQGHKLEVVRVPPEKYDTFFPGAAEQREMFQYFEEFTYFGPGHEERIRAANALVPGGFTGFAAGAKVNMKAR